MEDQLTSQAEPGSSPAAGRRRLGIVGDGVFKILLGAVYVIAASPVGHLLGVAVWLVITAGALVLMCGTAEIRYVGIRPAGMYLRLQAGYDTGWVLATLAALLVAWQGSTEGGEVWMTYQAVAAIVLAVLLTAGRHDIAGGGTRGAV